MFKAFWSKISVRLVHCLLYLLKDWSSGQRFTHTLSSILSQKSVHLSHLPLLLFTSMPSVQISTHLLSDQCWDGSSHLLTHSPLSHLCWSEHLLIHLPSTQFWDSKHKSTHWLFSHFYAGVHLLTHFPSTKSSDSSHPFPLLHTIAIIIMTIRTTTDVRITLTLFLLAFIINSFIFF